MPKCFHPPSKRSLTNPEKRDIRAVIKETAPDDTENISYGLPFYSYKNEQGFQARHCFFGLQKTKFMFYMRPVVFNKHKDQVKEYMTTKSALQFPLDKPVPLPPVKKLVRVAIRMHKAGEDN
jgi:uncharacterized protein YdhG (YjbR/CyaY superfamily)